jgi:hypothetical protein
MLQSAAAQTPGQRNKPRKPRPKRAALLVIPSGRTAEGRRLREFRDSLIRSVGGTPAPALLALIDRATVLQHHPTTFDRKNTETDGIPSLHSERRHLAWENTFTRLMRELGRHSAKPPTRTLADHLAEKAAARRASEAQAAGTPPARQSTTPPPRPPSAMPQPSREAD